MNSHKVWHGCTVDGEKRSKAVSSVSPPYTSFHTPTRKSNNTTVDGVSSVRSALVICDPRSKKTHNRFYARFESEDMS